MSAFEVNVHDLTLGNNIVTDKSEFTDEHQTPQLCFNEYF